MPERGSDPRDGWKEYYDRTRDRPLPAPERLDNFLDRLPEQHTPAILDAGCGEGRYLRGMHERRPLAVLDGIDFQPEALEHARQHVPDARYFQGDLASFTSDKLYDGIWARHSLFFLSQEDCLHTIRKLADALRPHGVFQFTMLAPCEKAVSHGMLALPEETIRNAVATAGLQVTDWQEECCAYGKSRVKMPTYFITAVKA